MTKLTKVERSEFKERLLKEKPTCYLIIGKPKTGKSTLARRICEEQKCIYVNPLQLLRLNIHQKTNLGGELNEKLLLGQSTDEETILSILEDKLSSPECLHYGYVLDGLFQVDNKISQNEKAANVVENQLELLSRIPLKPDVIIHTQISDEDLKTRIMSMRYNPDTGRTIIWKNYTELPAMKTDPDEKQDLPKKIKSASDEDAETVEGDVQDEEIDENEEQEKQEEPERKGYPGFELVPEETRVDYMLRTEYLEQLVISAIRDYRDFVWPKVAKYAATFDPLHIINLDAHQPPSELIRLLMIHLTNIHVKPAIMPVRMYGKRETMRFAETFPELDNLEPEAELMLDEQELDEDEEAVDEDVPEEMEDEDLWKTLGLKQLPAIGYRWQRSRFGHLCPVSLKGGVFVNGKLQFAVGFMGELYLMVDRESMELFLQNPRPYLLLPQPKNPVKWAIVGPPKVGLDDVASLLAYRESCAIIDAKQLMVEKLRDFYQEKLEEKRPALLEKMAELEETDADSHFKAILDSLLASFEEVGLEPDAKPAPEALAPIDELLRSVQNELVSMAMDAESSLYVTALQTAITARLNELSEKVDRKGHWIITELPQKRSVWDALVRHAEDRARLMQERKRLERELERKRALEEKRRLLLEQNPVPQATEQVPTDEEEEGEADEQRELKDETKEAEQSGDKEIVLPEIPPEILPDYVFNFHDSDPNYKNVIRKWHTYNLFGLGEIVEQTAQAADDATLSEAGGAEPQGPLGLELHPAAELARTEITKLEKNWNECINVLQSSVNSVNFPTTVMDVDIKDMDVDRLADSVQKMSNQIFEPVAQVAALEDLDAEQEEDTMAMEVQQEERDAEEAGAEEEEEEEEAAEEEEEEGADDEQAGEAEEAGESLAERNFGECLNFCPVTLLKHGVRLAGDPEFAVRFDGKIYHMADEEAQTEFLDKAASILDQLTSTSFQVTGHRYCILGGTGSGKSVHGKQLADRLGMVHISFQRMLQNFIMPKLLKNIGNEFVDDQLDPLLPLLELPEIKPDLDIEEAKNRQAELRSMAELFKMPQQSDEEAGKEGADEADENAPELTENERAVLDFLTTQESLPPQTLELLITPLWQQEPYLSSGIVLEGFPATVEQAEWMRENNFIPDHVFSLETEADEAVERLLPQRLAKWDRKRARVMQNRERRTNFHEYLASLHKAIRKKELLTEHREKVELKKKMREDKLAVFLAENPEAEPGEFEDDDEDEEEPDFDDIVDEETPEDEQEEDELEERADAEERLGDEIREEFETTVTSAQEIVEFFRESRIPCRTIDTSGRITRARYRFVNKVHPIVSRRASQFELVRPIEWKAAERLLRLGYMPLSKFGRWCPVALSDYKVTPPVKPLLPKKFIKHKRPATVVEPGEFYHAIPRGKKAACTAVYKNEIYWFENQNNLKKFTRNPLRYVNQRGHLPDVPLRMTKKVAMRLCKKYAIPRMTGGIAVRWLMSSVEHAETHLVAQIADQLNHGHSLPDSLVAAAMQLAIMTPVCATRGFVLDGYPSSAEQFDSFRIRNMSPSLVISLTADSSSVELMVRGLNQHAELMAKERERLRGLAIKNNPDDAMGEDEFEEGELASKKPSKDPIIRFDLPLLQTDVHHELAIKFAAYDEMTPDRDRWLDSRHGLRVQCDALNGRWNLWNKVDQITSQRQRFLQQYLEAKSNDKPGEVGQLGLLESEVKAQYGKFRDYCPVSLLEKGELVNANYENLSGCRVELVPGVVMTTKYNTALEYRNKYYQFAGRDEMLKFIQNPENYLPSDEESALPEMLPERLTDANIRELSLINGIESYLEFKGYCPVCFGLGNGTYEALVRGRHDIITQYGDKFYAFDSDECVIKFLRKPQQFMVLKLPHKLPPICKPLDLKTLPLPGYLEQTVSSSLRHALGACGQARPKYPFMRPDESALMFIALHLKAFNPRFKQQLRTIYRTKYDLFKDHCNIIPSLAKNMPIDYEFRDRMSHEATMQLEKFKELKLSTQA